MTYGRCFLCRRDCDETSVNVVMPDGSIGTCCGICWEKADEGVDVPLDYTEDVA
jgi:hypothetical protein